MLFYFLFQFQIIREHCRGKVPKVVAAAHHASVGACAADGEDVAPFAVGQFAAFAPNVARLAYRTYDIVKSLPLGAIYDIGVFHWDSVPNPDAPRGLCVLHVFAVANTRTRPVV